MPTLKYLIQDIKLLIVDDHQMIRDGIRAMLLSQKKHYNFIIEEACQGEEAVNKILRKDFDVILIDYCLTGIDGAKAVDEILLYKPNSKILALSNYDEYSYIEKMIAAGVKEYVLKNIEPSQLVIAIRTILAGNNYYSPEISIKLIDNSENNKKWKKVKRVLSKREIEVLHLLAKGLTNEEIASKLVVSKRTIDTHRQNMLVKLHVENSVSLIITAIKLGILDQF